MANYDLPYTGQQVEDRLGEAGTAYQKPVGGIPSTDMTSAVQTSLGKADTAYQKPSGGIPSTDMTSSVQSSLALADTAIQNVKTINNQSIVGTGNIEVVTDISGKADKATMTAGTYKSVSVNSQGIVTDGTNPTTLAGYGITDAYTKTEVNGLVDTPHQEYVTVADYASLPASGSKDTIYRVSNYDGSQSQVADDVYSEYAWDGTQYVFLCVKSQIGEVFDISVYNNNAKYADLAAALNGGANIPQSLRKGGMSVKFVQTSDNKYVQFRFMADDAATVATFTNVDNWQGVESNPTYSNNLVNGMGIVSHLEHFEITGKGNSGVSVYLEYLIPGKTYKLSMDKTWTAPSGAFPHFEVVYRPEIGSAITLLSYNSTTPMCNEYVITIPQDAGDGKLQIWCKIPQDISIKFSISEHNVDIIPKEWGSNLIESGSVKRLENVVNGTTQERNYLIDTLITRQGALSTNDANNVGTTDKLDAEAGDKILFFVGRPHNFYRIAFYDSSDNVLSVTSNVEHGVVVTAPADTSYMRYSFAISDMDKAYALIINKNKRYIPLDGMLSVDDRAEVVVDNALHTPEVINIERYSEYYNFVGSSNLWERNATARTILVPVQSGERYRITTKENYDTILAFFANRQVTSDQIAPFCTTYPGRIILAANTSSEYIIPDDCLYMAIYVKNTSGVDVSPTVELYEEKFIEENAEVSKFVIPYTDCSSTYHAYYINGAEVWANESGVGHLLVDIPESATDIIVNVDETENSKANIAFFTTNNINYNVAPPFVGNSTRNIIWPGENVKIEIPYGTKVLYIIMPTANAKYNISFLCTSDITEVLDETSYGTFTELDTTQATVYNQMYVGSASNPDHWNPITSRKVGVLAIPSDSKYLKITPQLNDAVFFLLSTNKTPVGDVVAELSEGYKDRIILPIGSSYIFPLLSDCKYIAYATVNASGNDITPLLSVASKATKATDKIVEEKCECFTGNEIWDVEFNDAPDVLFSNKDEDLPTTEGKHLSWYSVVKISENLYYMYYNTLGINDPNGDQYFHLAFAWSTDGLNWNKSIPSGITPPIPGTNLLFEQHVFGMDVVMVQDNDYPFRMVGFDWHASSAMYKSADGINWTKIREYPYYYDTQASVIVRGNTLKIYLRRRDGEGRLDRYIGIVTTDFDGNVLTPPTIFFGKYYYQASASAIDWRREIMFPTFFNPTDNTEHIDCFIVDENKIYPRNVDFSNIIGSEDLSMYVSPKIINIGNNFYIYYLVENTPHNGATNPTCTYKRAKITFKTKGYWWYPQP